MRSIRKAQPTDIKDVLPSDCAAFASPTLPRQLITYPDEIKIRETANNIASAPEDALHILRKLNMSNLGYLSSADINSHLARYCDPSLYRTALSELAWGDEESSNVDTADDDITDINDEVKKTSPTNIRTTPMTNNDLPVTDEKMVAYREQLVSLLKFFAAEPNASVEASIDFGDGMLFVWPPRKK